MDNEDFDLQNFPDSPSARRMLAMVTSGFYDRSYVGKWLYQVMGLEYDKAYELIESMAEQMFPETATWGLAYHEIKWGLPVREHLSYEERRRLIYEKRDFQAPMTPHRIEAYLDTVVDYNAVVADVHDPGEFGYVPSHPNAFKVFLSGDGTLDVRKVRDVLDSIKQSHTVYEIQDRVTLVIDDGAVEGILFPALAVACAIRAVSGRPDVKMRLAQKVQNVPERIDGEVIIFRDVWYLNGEYKLDGTRIWDTIYREEKL